jgi:putative DNA primase/helicase
MQYDGKIHIATGMSAKSKIWKNKTTTWSDLVAKISEPHHTNETFNEYMSAAKDDQSKIKDVGGYVGGYLRNGRRKPENVVHRQLMTLDIDFAHIDFWEDFSLQFDNAAILHATHKHSDESPRYRLIMPLSREATPDEYVAVSRKIAGILGIELFDNTTFETNRLMFWPSSPKDVDYYCVVQDGEWVDVDNFLNTYVDWKDSSLWPTADRKIQEVKGFVEKQEDPENKKGIVGAFCRAYTVTEAIAEFLQEAYTATTDGRFTYAKGSTASGLILYDDKFAYSHHGTDPCSGKLCNAFDLVRIHLFGHLDPDNEYRNGNTKSFKAMEEFARADKEVKQVIAAENFTESKYDFAEPLENSEEDIDWMQELDIDNKGKYTSSANNINLIFANDIRLKSLFKHNEFDGKRYVFGNVPWRKIAKPEAVKNVDYSGVRNYIESIYGIAGNLKIEDSMALEFERNVFHPVMDYLQGVKWDGIKRVDTLLIDYLMAEDNIYTREVTRKTLVGAVARIFKPGCKFDMVLTLIGDQGTGKSTIVKKLGGKWFSDTFMTVHGKEALEQIQGAWIIEMAELSGLRKADVESTKHFISKQEDTFRPAYARTSETYKRQCIFVGTSNKKDFLNDSTGNRRFNPVDVGSSEQANKNVWEDLTGAEIDNIWAEAVIMMEEGETLFLSKEANELAKIEQKNHSSTDERTGIIAEYLDVKLPENWGAKDVYQRRDFLADEKLEKEGTILRDYVCVAEIWCECLNKDRNEMDRYKTREINEILRSLEGWEQSKSTKNFKNYGKQKYYSRKID